MENSVGFVGRHDRGLFLVRPTPSLIALSDPGVPGERLLPLFPLKERAEGMTREDWASSFLRHQ